MTFLNAAGIWSCAPAARAATAGVNADATARALPLTSKSRRLIPRDPFSLTSLRHDRFLPDGTEQRQGIPTSRIEVAGGPFGLERDRPGTAWGSSLCFFSEAVRTRKKEPQQGRLGLGDFAS